MWKIADVEKFVKKLSPVEKKRWVEVANSESPEAATKAVKDFNLASFLDGPLVNIRGMEIFRVGTWNGRKFTEEDIKRMASNFKALKEQVVPKLKITHRTDQESLAGLASFGDIVNIEARETRGSLRLFADVDFVPSKVAEWIRDKRFAERSIELRLGFKVDDTVYKDVIIAVSLLGHEIPAVAGMEPIKLSKEDNLLDTKELVGITYALEGEEDMKFENSFARGDGKGQGGPSQGDGGSSVCVCPSCSFQKEHDKGTPCSEVSCPKCGTKMVGKDKSKEGGESMEIKDIVEKLATLSSAIEGIAQKQSDAEAKFAKEQDETTKAKIQGDLDTYKKELDGLKTMKTDYEKMKTSLDEAEKENVKLHAQAKESKVESFLKDLKTSGKVLPAFEAEAKAILLQLNEEDKLGTFTKKGDDGKSIETELSQFEAFQNLLSKLPKLVDFKEASPNGKEGEGELKDEVKVGDDTYKLTDGELEVEVQKYMKEHEDVSYTDALVHVSAAFKEEDKEQGLSDED